MLEGKTSKRKFAIGTIVELHSLSSAALNGRKGDCGDFKVKKGRYKVTLLEKDKKGKTRVLAVKPCNLKLPVRAPEADAEKAKALAFEAAKKLHQVRAANGGKDLFQEAIRHLDQAVSLDPRCTVAHQVRGDAAHMTNDHRTALIHFRRAAENGGGPQARLALSNALGETGDTDGEMKQLLLVTAEDPGNWMARINLGMAYSRQEMYEKCLQQYDILLSTPGVEKMFKQSPQTVRVLAHAKRTAGDFVLRTPRGTQGHFLGDKLQYVSVCVIV